jgi:regulator of sirC expression with transglutaminase-like and TPR domain
MAGYLDTFEPVHAIQTAEEMLAFLVETAHHRERGLGVSFAHAYKTVWRDTMIYIRHLPHPENQQLADLLLQVPK